jgi:hypothetical protein
VIPPLETPAARGEPAPILDADAPPLAEMPAKPSLIAAQP